MKKETKEHIISLIDDVLNNKKLNRQDRDKLIVIREKIKNCSTRSGIWEALIGFLPLLGVFEKIDPS